MLEAKAKDQGQRHKCSQKQKGLQTVFSGVLKKNKKQRFQKNFFRSPKTKLFKIIFQAISKILTIQKMVLSTSRGQDNFQGFEASSPRPRTSNCVLEAKNVFENSTSDNTDMLLLLY